jgi:hypothetical protein
MYEEFERGLALAEADTAETQDAALEEAARVREEAHREAQAKLAEARRQAEEIVQDAWRRAQEQSDRVVELLRLREGLMTSLGATVSQFDEALQRAANEEPPVVAPVEEQAIEEHAIEEHAIEEQAVEGHVVEGHVDELEPGGP